MRNLLSWKTQTMWAVWEVSFSISIACKCLLSKLNCCEILIRKQFRKLLINSQIHSYFQIYVLYSTIFNIREMNLCESNQIRWIFLNFDWHPWLWHILDGKSMTRIKGKITIKLFSFNITNTCWTASHPFDWFRRHTHEWMNGHTIDCGCGYKICSTHEKVQIISW